MKIDVQDYNFLLLSDRGVDSGKSPAIKILGERVYPPKRHKKLKNVQICMYSFKNFPVRTSTLQRAHLFHTPPTRRSASPSSSALTRSPPKIIRIDATGARKAYDSSYTEYDSPHPSACPRHSCNKLRWEMNVVDVFDLLPWRQ